MILISNRLLTLKEFEKVEDVVIRIKRYETVETIFR